MFANAKRFKQIITLALGIMVIFLLMLALQAKAAKEVPLPNISVTSPKKPVSHSNYAQLLTPEQVKAINTIKISPEASTKPLPPPEEIMPPNAPPATHNSGRCIYNQQTYALGDIVKTEKGWIRCTPTLTFNPNKPTLPQPDRPAWTKLQ